MNSQSLHQSPNRSFQSCSTRHSFTFAGKIPATRRKKTERSLDSLPYGHISISGSSAFWSVRPKFCRLPDSSLFIRLTHWKVLMALCLKISRAWPPSTFPQLPYWSTLHSSLLTRLVPSYTCFYSLFSTQHPEEPLKIGVKSGQSKSYTEEITVARRALHDLAVGISLASSSHIGLPACSAFLACLALSCTGLPLCWEVFPISSLPHLLVLSQMSFFSQF